MRKSLVSLLLLTVAGVQTGCGDAASQPAALDRAVTSFDRAQRGYVPGESGIDPMDARAYRQHALSQTADELANLVSSGSDTQQMMARRLQASIDASAAHHATREAAMAYATLAPRAVKLMSHVVVADRAAARGQGLDLNQPELIKALESEVEAQTARQQQLQQEATKLADQLKAEQAEKSRSQAARDEATNAAQTLRSQGFVAQGDEQYELYDQAAQQQRQASIAMAEMERRQLNIDMLNSQLGVVNSQLSLTNGLLSELKERIAVARQRQQEVDQGVAAAAKDRDAALAQLNTEFEQVLEGYARDVAGPLTTASQRMAAAVQHLEAALALSNNVNDVALRQSLQADVLGALTTHAQVLAEHMQVVAGFHQTLTLLSESVKRIDPARAGVYETALAELAARRSQLAAQARQTIESAQQVAGQLSGAAAGIADAAETQSQRLQRLAGIVGRS